MAGDLPHDQSNMCLLWKFGSFSLLLKVLLFFVNPVEVRRGEQRVSLKFLAKSGQSPIQCWRALRCVWGDDTMCKTQVRVWHKRFLAGQNNIKDSARSGRPRTKRTPANVRKVKQLIEANGHLSLNDLQDQTGLSRFVVLTILKKDLKLSRRASKFVPKHLSDDQKATRKRICQENLDLLCNQDDPETFLQSIVTGDETWLSTSEPLSKMQNSVWIEKGAPRPKTARPNRFARKTMLTLFFDANGVILMEFMKPGTKIDSEAYCHTLSNLKEAIRKKRPNLWRGRKFLIHHDNASPHTCSNTETKMKKWGLKTLPHPVNSPDCAPCDFSLFPKLKAELRGRRFQNIAELQKEARKILLAMDKNIFMSTMHDLVTRWQKCVKAEGAYFEGDHVQVEPLFERVDPDGNSSGTSSEED